MDPTRKGSKRNNTNMESNIFSSLQLLHKDIEINKKGSDLCRKHQDGNKYMVELIEWKTSI